MHLTYVWRTVLRLPYSLILVYGEFNYEVPFQLQGRRWNGLLSGWPSCSYSILGVSILSVNATWRAAAVGPRPKTVNQRVFQAKPYWLMPLLSCVHYSVLNGRASTLRVQRSWLLYSSSSLSYDMFEVFDRFTGLSMKKRSAVTTDPIAFPKPNDSMRSLIILLLGYTHGCQCCSLQ